nr:hypothetical protein [uncultured Pseudodesulfovibrio sp.]
MIRLPERCPIWAWIIPPIFLAVWVFSFSVDVLHWDEWIIWGKSLAKMKAGTFSLSDLAAQQNEQRNLAARVFGFLLMPIFKLNRFAEYGLNILLAAGAWWASVALYARTSHERTPQFVSLVFSMLVFSIVQWEAFSLGANSSVLILPLGVWLGALVATSGPPTVSRLLLLGVVGILPSFSFANGLFYWFCLAPIIFVQAKKTNGIWVPMVLWGAMTVAAWSGYFVGFESPGHHPSILSGLSSPFRFAGYFLAYMGGSISSDKNLYPLAIMVGGLSFPLMFLLAWREWKEGGERFSNALPWLCVALFSLMSAGVTALARCDFGIQQGLESRYATFSTPYWMALGALFAMAWERVDERDVFLRMGRRFLVTCCVVFFLSSILASIVVFNRQAGFERARVGLFTLTDDAGLQQIFPDTAYLMKLLPLFVEKRLSIYKGIKPFDEYSVDSIPIGSFRSEGMSTAAEGRVNGFLLRGEVQQGGVEQPVLIVVNSKVVGVSKANDRDWELFVPAAWLPEGTVEVVAYSILKTGDWVAPFTPVSGVPLNVVHGQEPEYTVTDYFFTN